MPVLFVFLLLSLYSPLMVSHYEQNIYPASPTRVTMSDEKQQDDVNNADNNVSLLRGQITMNDTYSEQEVESENYNGSEVSAAFPVGGNEHNDMVSTTTEILQEDKVDDQDNTNYTYNNKSQKQNETAILCAMVKDEERYLKEWILYNLGLGFDKVVLYDNSKNSSTAPWLKTQDSQVQQGTIVRPFPNHRQTRQNIAYKECVERYGKGGNHTWAAFFDSDEFLVLKKHETVVDLLKETCPNGSVAINWLIYGTGNQTHYEPKPVVQRFQYHTGMFKAVKTMVRISDYKYHTSPHWAHLVNDNYRRDTHGKYNHGGKVAKGVFNPSHMPNGPLDVAAIHHYKFKSEEEYTRKYCQRGRAWHKYGELRWCDDNGNIIGDQSEMPPGDIHDDSAWKLLQKNVPEYAAQFITS